MLSFWILIFSTAIAAFVFVGLPLWRPAPAVNDAERKTPLRSASDVDVDIEYGLVEAAVAPALLQDATEIGPAIIGEGTERFRIGRFVAFAVLGLAPLCAIWIYLNIGAPEYFETQRATATEIADLPDKVEAALEALTARAKVNPDDTAAWIALGDMQVAAGLAGDAVMSFERAIDLDKDNARAHSALGEAISMEADGAINARAREAFQRAVDLDGSNPRARYYLAEARFQAGSPNDALAAWAALLNDAPSDAPWFQAVAARMATVADEAGIASGALGLSQEVLSKMRSGQELPPSTVDAAQAVEDMNDDERSEMIASMVDGLAARLEQNPDDADGWRRLARSYEVLGRIDESAQAWRTFLQRFDGTAADYRQYAVVLLSNRDPGDDDVSDELETALIKLREFNQDDPLALYQLGHAARNKGHTDEAVALWRRLLEVLPDDAPVRAALEDLITETSVQ